MLALTSRVRSQLPHLTAHDAEVIDREVRAVLTALADAELADVRRDAVQALRPPLRLRLSEWLEGAVRLPEGTTALPGPMRL